MAIKAKRNHAPVTLHPDTLLLDVKQVALITNKGISTVWADTKNGDLPAPIKVGKSTRWRRKDIQDWLAQFGVELEG